MINHISSSTAKPQASTKLSHKYIAVLGSCCTGDAVGATSFDTIATAKLRQVLYQGRTSFLSMATPGLLPEEFEFTENAQAVSRLDWGNRMAADEATKKHQQKVVEAMGLADALVIDNVTAFVFPMLADRSHARYFIQSWEWEKFISPRIDLRPSPLWDIPIERSLKALREMLGLFYEKQPALSVVFHVPEPCFNDGVKFEDPSLELNIDFYRHYCLRIYDEATRHFPRVSAISPPNPSADPVHPSGAHPFRYEKSYLDSVRLEIERILNV
jgi:hypothetical protein